MDLEMDGCLKRLVVVERIDILKKALIKKGRHGKR